MGIKCNFSSNCCLYTAKAKKKKNEIKFSKFGMILGVAWWPTGLHAHLLQPASPNPVSPHFHIHFRFS